jgi:hypothetical protein
MSMKLGMPNSEIGSNFIINFSLTQFYLAHDAKKNLNLLEKTVGIV